MAPRLLLLCVVLAGPLSGGDELDNDARGQSLSWNPAVRVGRDLDANPSGIHLSWSETSGASSMTVTWLTGGGSNLNQVRYGLTPAYELGTITGSEIPSPFRGKVHTVILDGLDPETEYHYSVSPDLGGGWSADRTFTTGPVLRRPVLFLAAGDCRQAQAYPNGNLDRWSQLVPRMQAEGALLTLMAGDLVFDATTGPYWLELFDVSEPLASASPFMPCVGNHDVLGDGEGVAYTSFFALPEGSGTERRYSFDVGTVHFIVPDSQFVANAAQLEWIEQDLAAASQWAEWIVALFHKPPYVSGTGATHPPNATVQTYWVPLFDAYHVDLALNGHNHFYQRTFPIYGGADPANPTVVDNHPDTYLDPAGTVYVITGGGGAPTSAYYPDDNEPYIAAYLGDTLQYVKVTVDAGALHLQAISAGGFMFDQFRILKPVAFADDFETGDTTMWSSIVVGP
jgi:hypothetical protein